MQFGKRIGPLARRVAAMQIPVYAGNASFFLLLSVFPVVSLLLCPMLPCRHLSFFISYQASIVNHGSPPG